MYWVVCETSNELLGSADNEDEAFELVEAHYNSEKRPTPVWTHGKHDGAIFFTAAMVSPKYGQNYKAYPKNNA